VSCREQRTLVAATDLSVEVCDRLITGMEDADDYALQVDIQLSDYSDRIH